MTTILTSAQMRGIEHAAIESGAVSGQDLMERAGQGVVDAIFAEWPDLRIAPHRVAVLCGPGNNGGDGFVVARLLHRWGWQCDVYLLGDPDRLPPDARTNFDRWSTLGAVRPLDQLSGPYTEADVWVDALFGTGLVRPVDGYARKVLQALSVGPDSVQRLVAVDIPSGLCADSGKVLGGWGPGPSSLTVTFHRAKLGHYLEKGPWLSGKLVQTDIGLPDTVAEAERLEQAPVVRLVTHPDRAEAAVLCRAGGAGATHKFSHGHVYVVSGGFGRTGAARLSARAALRAGAGLVTLGVPPEATGEVAAQITAVMMREVAGAETLGAHLADRRLNALCIGPGLGLEDAQMALVAEVLKARRATVLDADALTHLARDPALQALLHDQCVLTPHQGEFTRLFPDIAETWLAPPAVGPAYSKVQATRAAARSAGCVILFKGMDTVIAAPDGRCAIHAAAFERAAPCLATAGSGDVLSGIIAGLLAQGLHPMDAAGTGAWLHTEAARIFGPGLIAEDLPEQLPAVLRMLQS